MKVVAFNGSPRREGNTALLLRKVLSPIARSGIDTELVQVGGQAVHGCTACYHCMDCLLYTSPSPRDRQKSRMPSSA